MFYIYRWEREIIVFLHGKLFFARLISPWCLFSSGWLLGLLLLMTDKHLQWVLLWLLLSQQGLQAHHVDGSLVWLVVNFLSSPGNSFLPVIYFLDLPSNHWNSRFTAFGTPVPHRPVEDLAFAVARFIQKGGSFVNYYMVFLSLSHYLFRIFVHKISRVFGAVFICA